MAVISHTHTLPCDKRQIHASLRLVNIYHLCETFFEMVHNLTSRRSGLTVVRIGPNWFVTPTLYFLLRWLVSNFRKVEAVS
jgi:hypothetical protein